MLNIISDMDTTTPENRTTEIKRMSAEIKRELLALGAMHPGSITRQYQVCGKPGCKCMHPEKPERHGPYHKLAYVHRGKPVCRFVRADCVERLKDRLATYKTFRALVDRWIDLSIRQGADDFFGQAQTGQRVNRSKQISTAAKRGTAR